MDDDDFRRGRPSNHKVFGEAIAILAGDALLTLAFEWIAEAGARAAAPRGASCAPPRALARGAGCGGWCAARRATWASRRPPRWPRSRRCTREKTAALFRAALEVGGGAAGAPPDELAALARSGRPTASRSSTPTIFADAEHRRMPPRRRATAGDPGRRGRATALAPLGRAALRLAELVGVAATANRAQRRVSAATAPPAVVRWSSRDGRRRTDTAVRGAGAPAASVKRDRAYLVVLAGASVGEMYKIDGEKTIIGRGQKAHIRLFDDGISREHAQIVVEGSRSCLQDLGSTNGTYCNGLKVDKKELVDGDKILVGSTTILKFTYHDNLDEIFQRRCTSRRCATG